MIAFYLIFWFIMHPAYSKSYSKPNYGKGTESFDFEYSRLVYPRIRSFSPSKILSIRRVWSTFSAPLRMTKSMSPFRMCGPSTSKESASLISR